MLYSILDKLCYAIAWWWVWSNENYRRSYWLYVTGIDWFWMHVLADPNEEKK